MIFFWTRVTHLENQESLIEEKKMFSQKIVLLQGDDWSLDVCHMNKDDADKFYEELQKLPLQKRPELNRIWNGYHTRMRRDFEFFATGQTSYIVSKKRFPAVQVNGALENILHCVNTERGESYNAMLLNRYRDENESIGPHCDVKEHLGKFGVCTLSFGQTRICRFRKRVPYDEPLGDVVLDVPCVHGSMLSMVGTFQDYFTHEIPALEVREDAETKIFPRLSVTFRWMKDLDTNVKAKAKPTEICVTCCTNPVVADKKFCRFCMVAYQTSLHPCGDCGTSITTQRYCAECTQIYMNKQNKKRRLQDMKAQDTK